jgi:hypothetical protein
VIATFLGAGQLEMLTQEIEQAHAGVKEEIMSLSIDFQTARHGAWRRSTGLRIGRQYCRDAAGEHNHEFAACLRQLKNPLEAF